MAGDSNGRPNSAAMTIVNRAIDDLHGFLGLGVSDFFCECGHPGCRERITLTRAEYANLRAASRAVHTPDHADDQSAELHELRRRVAQLQGALNSRVIIEQAKGVIVERTGCTPDAAFSALRRRSRDERRKLSDVCAETIASATTSAGADDSAPGSLDTRASLRTSDPRGN